MPCWEATWAVGAYEVAVHYVIIVFRQYERYGRKL